MSDLTFDEVWESAFDRLRVLESDHQVRRDVICEFDDEKAESSIYRVLNGQKLINFSSNDYLDLATHPRVKAGAAEAIEKYGTGAVASRLVCGTLPLHHQLEESLAKLKGTESALVFSSGYLACLGAISVLSRRADDSSIPILFDRQVHASLVDGATRNRRSWRSFPHNNVKSLRLLLEKVDKSEWPSALVVTEGVFSMDGDLAPLQELSELCAEFRALLLVDDAHGTGIMGEDGRGSVQAAGLADAPHIIQVGTLSKSLGSQGGFVAGPAVLRELLVNRARTFIYDTGLNPAAVGGAIAALEVLADEPERREKLRENVKLFRSVLGWERMQPHRLSPVVPIILGGEKVALRAANVLREEGFLVVPIRPPTVARGTSRLRITLSSAHTKEDVRRLCRLISQLDVR